MNSIFIWTVGDVIGLAILALCAVAFGIIMLKSLVEDFLKKRRRNDKNHVLKK